MGENDSFRRGTPCYDGTRFTHLNDDFTLLVACYDVRFTRLKARLPWGNELLHKSKV